MPNYLWIERTICWPGSTLSLFIPTSPLLPGFLVVVWLFGVFGSHSECGFVWYHFVPSVTVVCLDTDLSVFPQGTLIPTAFQNGFHWGSCKHRSQVCLFAPWLKATFLLHPVFSLLSLLISPTFLCALLSQSVTAIVTWLLKYMCMEFSGKFYYIFLTNKVLLA